MERKFTTEIVHFSEHKNTHIASKTTPIYQTSAFVFQDLEELEGYYHGNGNYLYSRNGNPNTDELGQAVARLEGAPAGVATSSGISAILAGVLAVVQQGDHIVAADDLYGGTFHFFNVELQRLGIEVSFVSFKNLENVERAIRPNTKLLYTEIITNPLLRVENIDEFVALAKKHQLITMVDNTFATPYLYRPYLQGVDLIVHSATKYIGGHSDITAGVIAGREDLIQRARERVVSLGANLSAFEAWLTCRGLKTLALRMERQTQNAKLLATVLKKNELIKKVYYPEYVSEKGNGAMVTIELEEQVNVNRFFQSLEWVKIVPTLAGVETTVSHPLTTSHRALPTEKNAELGINKQVVRISVGIEDAEDMIQVFRNALTKSVM